MLKSSLQQQDSLSCEYFYGSGIWRPWDGSRRNGSETTCSPEETWKAGEELRRRQVECCVQRCCERWQHCKSMCNILHTWIIVALVVADCLELVPVYNTLNNQWIASVIHSTTSKLKINENNKHKESNKLVCTQQISLYHLTEVVFTMHPHCLQCMMCCNSYGLSVRPSCSDVLSGLQKNEDTIMRSSVSGSTMILVSGEVKFIRTFTGDYPQQER